MFKRRFAALGLIGLLIFVAGALVGRAQQQRQEPDFVIDISPSSGSMTAECRTGCKLQVVLPAGPERQSYTITEKYTYTCPGTNYKYAVRGLISRGIATSN
jgi:hypothetical protein